MAAKPRKKQPPPAPAELHPAVQAALPEAVPCALAVLDAEGRIVLWNGFAERLTGYPAEEVLGQTCEVIRMRLAPHQDPDIVEALCPFHGEGREADEEAEIRRKDGTVVPVVRRARTVTDTRGRPVGAIQAMVDASILKAARTEIRTLKNEIARAGRFGPLIGSSPAMQELYEAISMVAATDSSVVIEGETGAGKELVARTIHTESRRRNGVFLAVNCGALPENLLEAELFGHVAGAFTGATADRAGRFEEAAGGTLLLDEIGELPLASQVKLLRVIEQREVTRVGENLPRPVDVRIIAATNRNLAAEVKARRFREDLYYRLRVVGLRVPPLRRRKEDLADLVTHFLDRLNERYGRAIRGLAAAAMEAIERYDWPGNVRQLQHALEHAFVVTAADAKAISLDALPAEVTGKADTDIGHADRAAPPGTAGSGGKAELQAALRRFHGNKAAAARALGLTRGGLYKRMKRYGIS